MFSQLRVLSSYPHRTCVGMTFTHHDTSQYNQDSRSETEFLGSQQGHADNVVTGFYLSVGL